MKTHAMPLILLAGLAGCTLLAGCTAGGGSTTTRPVTPVSSAPSAPPASGAGSGSGGTGSGGTGSASTPAGGASGGTSAAGLLSAALTGLKNGGSVHVDISNTSASGTVTFSDDATATGGRQDITIDTSGHVTIVYTGGTGYVSGDALGLVGLFGLAQSQAQQLGGRWIAVHPGDKLGSQTYAQLVDGITLSAVASELQVPGPDTLTAPATIDGQRVVGVQSPPPASQKLPGSARLTLYVTASGPARPVMQELSGVAQTQDTIAFSHWGEAVSLPAPANPLPASALEQPILT